MSETNYAKKIYHLIIGTIIASIALVVFSIFLDYNASLDAQLNKAHQRMEKIKPSGVPFVP